MPSPTPFGLALAEARRALHLTQQQLAESVLRQKTAVFRWEKGIVEPELDARIAAVRALRAAPRPLLEALAKAGGVSLDAIGLGLPPPPAPPSPSPATPPAGTALDPSAQVLVDDAIREAAEEIDVSPRLLRPAISRMLDRIAKAGVPTNAAARMVLGVPKKDPTPPAKTR